MTQFIRLMKTQLFFLLLGSSLVFNSCTNSQKDNVNIVDSLTTEISEQTAYMNFVKQENPNVI